MEWIRGEFLQSGKGKMLYRVKGDPMYVWMEFKDDLTAFNGEKKASFKGKGVISHFVSAAVFRYLKSSGVRVHWVGDAGAGAMVCRKLQIIPLEVVVRNRLAGSTAKRLGLREGTFIKDPLVEFYYKKDELGDPFINKGQAVALQIVPDGSCLNYLEKEALRINPFLKKFFHKVGLELIDFKLEFGFTGDSPAGVSNILLADEISCDSCRLWDEVNGKKMDKDCFRFNLGDVGAVYQEVYDRVKKEWGAK